MKNLKKTFFTLLLIPLFVVADAEFTPPKNLLDVPSVTQSTDYSCGAAALLSILYFYGERKLDEITLIKELKSSPETGTEIEPIVEFAKTKGLTVVHKEKGTWDELKEHLAKKQVSLVSLQAWDETSKEPNYIESWESGHYLVVIGMDENRIYFMDPASLGTRGYLEKQDFLSRWHDVGPTKNHLEQPVVFFTGTAKPPQIWARIP